MGCPSAPRQHPAWSCAHAHTACGRAQNLARKEVRWLRSACFARVPALRLHDTCAAPASLLGMAAFHLRLAALRACCGCMALLAIMRRACTRRLHEPCVGAAGTYDLAADDAPPASSVARVIVSDGRDRVIETCPQRARTHPLPITAARYSPLVSAAACLTGSYSSTKSSST